MGDNVNLIAVPELLQQGGNLLLASLTQDECPHHPRPLSDFPMGLSCFLMLAAISFSHSLQTLIAVTLWFILPIYNL